MKRLISKPVSLALIPATLAAGVAGAAWAGTDSSGEMSDAQEVQAALDSGMTLAQAVDAAQAQTGGTALSAEWNDNDQGQWGYEVEIADAANFTQDWFVNPTDGSITKVTESDEDDHENGEEDDDD